MIAGTHTPYILLLLGQFKLNLLVHKSGGSKFPSEKNI